MMIAATSTNAGILPARRYSIDDIHRRLGPLAQYIASRYNVNLGKQNGNVQYLQCPTHRGSVTSAHTTAWENGNQTFKCWSCGEKAIDVIDLTAELEHMSRGEAIQLLGDTVGADSDHQLSTPKVSPHPKREQKRRVKTDDLSEKMDKDRVTNVIAAAEALKRYCNYRGWQYETADAMDIHLAFRRYKNPEGEWERHEVMRHPFHARGKVIGWQDRTKGELKNHYGKWATGGGQQLPEFNVDGIDHVKDLGLNEVVIVEGIADAITLLDVFGRDYPVLGLVGAGTVNPYLFEAISDMEVVLVPDNDKAGSVVAEKFEVTRERFKELTIIKPPDEFKDLSEWFLAIGDRIAFAVQFEEAIIASQWEARR
jgi:DNA primase